MATKKLLFIGLFFVLVLASCERLIIKNDTPTDFVSSFEYLWKSMDEKYSYFEQKNINWKALHSTYRQEINKCQTNEEAFIVMANMLNELQDGHVNLVSDFNVSYYRFDRGWPVNFDENVLENYYLDYLSDSIHQKLSSGKNFNINQPQYHTGPLSNQVFEVDTSLVAYIRYSSFAYTISSDEWQYVLDRFNNAHGIIIDVRSNGGGDPTNLFRFLEKFINDESYIYTSFLKTGTAHDAFNNGTEAILQPNPYDTLREIPVRILINRGCYSATSFFAAAARSLHAAGHDIKLIGDYTGGGAGAPGGGELPNGWYYRVSETQTVIKREAVDSNEIDKGIIPLGMFTDEYFHFESGVPPHIRITMQQDEIMHGRDMILETAIEDLLTQE